MEFVVRVWTYNGHRPAVTKYYEFNDIDEAKAFADERVLKAKNGGYEFDIMIYEATNY